MKRKREDDEPKARFSLHLDSPVPDKEFVDAWFSVRLFLVDSVSKKPAVMKTDVQIFVTALYENHEVVPRQNLIEIKNNSSSSSLSSSSAPQIRLGNDGSASFSLRFRELSMSHSMHSFYLRFSSDSQEINATTTSNPMLIIRHSLKIIEQPATSFYKDEGGKDKGMSMSICLVGSDSNKTETIVKGFFSILSLAFSIHAFC